MKRPRAIAKTLLETFEHYQNPKSTLHALQDALQHYAREVESETGLHLARGLAADADLPALAEAWVGGESGRPE